MAQKTAVEYPSLPSILALIGGAIILLFAVLLLAVSIVILPHLNYTTVTTPHGYTGSISSLVSGIVAAAASFGLVCGIIILISAIALRLTPHHR